MTPIYPASRHICGGSHYKITRNREEVGRSKLEAHTSSIRRRHIVKESWCREVRGNGRRGISFAWRQHQFFFIDLSLLALSYEKLEEAGKENEEKEED